MDDSAKDLVDGARIVVLSQDSSLAWLAGGPGMGDVARVASGYEAAAELLACPAVALVVDLRLLGGKHLGLLDIARSLDVEVLAVGSLPIGMTAEDLSGVRLIARRDLAAALGAVARAPAPRPAEARPVEPAAIPQPPAPAAMPEPAAEQVPARPPIKLVSAKTPLATRAGRSAPASTPDEPPDEPMDEEAAPALAMVDLPPAVDKALNGATLPSKGIEARRSGGAPGADSHSPGRAGNGHHTPPAPAPAQGHADGLLTPEELNALLGDDA